MKSANSTVPVPLSPPLGRVTALPSSSRTYYRRPFLTTLLILLSISSSPSTNFAKAIQCTYPAYNTQVQPGESVVVAWEASQSDISRFSGVTATMYCMDIDGMNGGTWKVATKLFQNTALQSFLNQFRFTIPNCGSLAANGAIRLVAQGNGNKVEESSCYFTMKQTIAGLPPPPPPPPPPILTTTKPQPSNNPRPPTASTTTSPPDSITSRTSTAAIGTGTINIPSSVPETISSIYPVPSRTPTFPFPPLPPLPPIDDDLPVTGSDSGLDGPPPPKNNTLAATFGSIAGTAALIAVISILVKKRRRRCRHVGGNRAMKSRLRIKGLGVKSSNKNDPSDRSFYLMKEVSDDDDDYNDKAPAKKATRQFGQNPTHIDSDSSEKLLIDFGDETEDVAFGIQRPESAYLDPTRCNSPPNPLIYSDEDFSMSSMRSSCETSSVVRQYWAASMAARAERRQEGYSPSTGQFEEGIVFSDNCNRSSISSQSRKADILSMNSEGARADAELSSAAASPMGGAFKKHYRNTINSMHSYLRRSMSMSMASLRSGSFTDDESWYRHPGFRSSINADFLDHLNIKSVQSGQRQLDYYRYYYRQNPTMSTVDGSVFDRPHSQQSVATSADSQRMSYVPSLTSTNDPFQTFDSNEIVLDLNPFSDHNAINVQELPPPPPLLQIGVNNDGQRSNSALLRSFPSPPISPTTSM
ncbi:hypothetical protein BGX27_000349 [Mortierella sp. AM989]|nr:hypothetical protein BGX27_000349 [Mortierella sp. AM989]